MTKKPIFGMTLGILGGGQLGRMSAMAAARLGIKTIIFCTEENAPASHVAYKTIIANYDDKAALAKFADESDFISYEFENIPVKTIRYLDSLNAGSVRPSENLLNVAQDRIREKTFLNDLGINTANWSAVSNLDDIIESSKSFGFGGFIIKTARFGYDGKGQIKCTSNDIEDNKKLAQFLESNKDQPLIMEDLINFSAETSVIIARNNTGNTEIYGPMLNDHKNHILHKTYIPSGLAPEVEKNAILIAEKIAEEIGLIGVLTVELFICDNGKILANEIAPRTHNSGHWSIDACAASQFENHVRAVCDLPLGSAQPLLDATMLNLIGDDIHQIDTYLGQDNACLHLYGKTETRKGRKMGHVNFLSQKKPK